MSSPQPAMIGSITEAVIAALGLSVAPGTPIYMGQSNITHMLNRHNTDYLRYGAHIHDIINNPDYVGINPGDNSIEYVKDFAVDGNFVKVAVRVAQSGKYYARSLYVLNPSRVQNFIASGTLKTL